jgi:hypothetical protein
MIHQNSIGFQNPTNPSNSLKKVSISSNRKINQNSPNFPPKNLKSCSAKKSTKFPKEWLKRALIKCCENIFLFTLFDLLIGVLLINWILWSFLFELELFLSELWCQGFGWTQCGNFPH